MSDLPSMPYYVDDFEADTPHLSLEEDGAYNRLLRLCWRSPECSIPDDQAWIQRRMRVDQETFERVVAPLLAEFFSRDKGRIWQKRQRQEYTYVTAMVARRKEAGAKGGYAKALQRKEIDPSNTNVLPLAKRQQNGSNALASTSTSTTTSSKEKREAIASPKTKGSRLSPDWQLPSDWAAWATAQGLANPTSEADRFRDYWIATSGAKGVKTDWLATWRNWVRKAITDQATKPGHAGQFQSDPRHDPKHGDEKIGLGGVKLKWSAPRNQWLKAEDWKP